MISANVAIQARVDDTRLLWAQGLAQAEAAQPTR